MVENGYDPAEELEKHLQSDIVILKRAIEDFFHEEAEGLDVRFFSNEIDVSELPSCLQKCRFRTLPNRRIRSW